MPTQINSEDTVVFIGDSITDCDRKIDPLGLGHGFVRLFSDMLLIREPEKHIQIINRGISGQTVVELFERWDADVLAHRPDWLNVLIGINDLHTWLHDKNNGVGPEQFLNFYRECLKKTRKELPNCQILLIDPFYICLPATADEIQSSVLNLLPEYQTVVSDMSYLFKTRVLRMHSIFVDLLQSQPGEKYAPEPVHPNATGHLAIAQAIYEKLWR